ALLGHRGFELRRKWIAAAGEYAEHRARPGEVEATAMARHECARRENPRDIGSPRVAGPFVTVRRVTRGRGENMGPGQLRRDRFGDRVAGKREIDVLGATADTKFGIHHRPRTECETGLVDPGLEDRR